MQSFNQFIFQYENFLSIEFCDAFSKWCTDIKEKGFIGRSEQEQAPQERAHRKDKLIHVPAMFWDATGVLPAELFNPLLQKLNEEALSIYEQKYHHNMRLITQNFKIHFVEPTEGYHGWHQERGTWETMMQELVWMIYIEAPPEGGETEFLFQSVRVKPERGKLLMWPAFWTHHHRGNPPLGGTKMYVTGWFRNQNA